MSFCCFSYNVLKSVIDLSNVKITIDVSKNIIDLSNITVHLDISNNERIISESMNEATQVLTDVKEIAIDISNNLQHILHVKEEFLAVDLTEPLLPLDSE